MFKNKLSIILTILVIGSSLLVAYTSLEKDILAPVENGDYADHGPGVITDNDSPRLVSSNSTDRRWSGEVFLSDNGSPDLIQQARESSKQDSEPACMSLNDGNSARRYGGCVE